MTKITTLEQLLDAGEAHARRVLIEDGHKELMPMFHLVTAAGEGHAIATPWTNNFEKEMSVATVKAHAEAIDAVMAMSLAEAWAVTTKEAVPNTAWHRQRAWERALAGDPPSQRPDRVEVVSIAATDGTRSIGRLLQQVRDKATGKVKMLVPMDGGGDASGIAGRMVDLLPHRR